MPRRPHSVFDIRSEAGRTRPPRLASFSPDLYWWIVAAPGGDGARPPRDEHPFHEVICVLEGRGVIELGRARFDAGPGEVFIVNPGESHREYTTGQAPFTVQYLAFACSAKWATVVRRALGVDAFPTRIDDARGALFDLLGLLQAELSARAPFHERVVSAHLDAFLFRLLRVLSADGGEAPAPKVAPRVADLIKRMPPGRLTVDQMAENCFLSRSYFTKVFKKETGESPARFVLRARMAEAKSALSGTDDTVAAIAHRLGFDDEFYFSKVFKRMVGVSPSRYRSTK